jgi:hypothetical protein
VLRAAQTLLDRVLFCAFSEDRGLLPPDTLKAAFEHRDPYNPRPLWENFQGLFRAIDQGSRALLIPAYNSGLFAFDPAVDGLTVPDDLCALFRELGEYDYGRPAAAVNKPNAARPVVDVDLLGRLVERSLTDLEELQAELGGTYPPPRPSPARGRGKSRSILTHNLYAVDLNEEAIELCRLSIWIKTAKHGRPLTALDHNFRVGNSLVADPAADARAFDWHAAFLEVFAAGGFDAVVGNPPYVRQELLGSLKPYLAKRFTAYHGMADLYVYFYELGLQILRPGGRLAYVVTNKWLKAGYGEPLRRHLGEAAWVEALVDLGHAKQVFEDADVFPSLLVARKPDAGPEPEEVRVAVIPHDELATEDLGVQVEAWSFPVPRRSLGATAWSLEPPAVATLLEKIRAAGVPLREYAGVKPLYGVTRPASWSFPSGGRWDAHEARRGEVGVEGKGGRDPSLAHEREAHGVGQAEVLVVIAPQDLLGLSV